MNGSEAESEVVSESDPIEDTDSQKLDASHREILEKLKRQEMEEREEIERELREAQKDALHSSQHGEEKENSDNPEEENVEGLKDEPIQTEIKTQRPPGLLAQHGITTKSHIDREREREKEREKEKEREREREREMEMEKDIQEEAEREMECEKERLERIGPIDFTHPAFMDRPFSRSPPMVTTPTGLPSIGGSNNSVDTVSSSPGHHWTFEEQFKQVSGFLLSCSPCSPCS